MHKEVRLRFNKSEREYLLTRILFCTETVEVIMTRELPSVHTKVEPVYIYVTRKKYYTF